MQDLNLQPETLRAQSHNSTPLKTTLPYLRQSPKLGSVRYSKVNYAKQEQYYCPEDISEEKHRRKKEVKEFLYNDILGTKKKAWNISVEVPKRFQDEESHQRKLLKVKKGIQDQMEPHYRPSKIYTGTQTRNDYTKWNVSVEFSRKEHNSRLQQKNHKAKNNSRLNESAIMSDYRTPLAKTNQFIQNTKALLGEDTDFKRRVTRDYCFDHPTASPERIRGAVHRLVVETAIKERLEKEEIETLPSTRFKANLSKLQKSKIKAEYSHSGVWQKFRDAEGEQQWAWSCCQNQEKESRGCVKRVIDSNKPNYSSCC